MKAQRDIASFVLRFTQELWQDPQGEPRVEWRGHIRHVQDGDEFRFTELTEVMNFIQQSLLKLTMDCMPKEDKMYQDKALRESFKLWEKFATSYTEVMAEAVQQTVKQSEVFQKQVTEVVEQVMKPWWLVGFPTQTPEPAPEKTAAADQTQMMQTLLALQAQITALTSKVDKLEAALATPTDDLQPDR
ncbi:hypothetical protein BH10CHL1_BH10CHL1_17650 [soil metagenome]